MTLKRRALLALWAYTPALFVYTLGKSFFSMPGVWRAEAQHARQLRLVPFDEILTFPWKYGPWLDCAGNLALFFPWGLALGILLPLIYGRQSPRPLCRHRLLLMIAAIAGATSLSIEITQYIGALGYSDIDDVILNTTGAVAGATLGQALSPVRKKQALSLSSLVGVGLVLISVGLMIAT